MSKERRLGRGLEALLGRVAASASPSGQSSPGAPVEHGPPDAQAPVAEAPAPRPSEPDSPPPEADAFRVDVSGIDSNPFQPRQDFDPAELDSLSDSLRVHGLLQPLVVRRAGDRYQLIAGERRLQAAVKAGWPQVPVRLIEADDREMAELAIVENMQRKDLNPLEKAASFQRYLQQYGTTQEELAGRLKLNRSTIANLIRLLELPEPVQEAVRRGKITQGHARALLPLGDEREQIEFCGQIQEEGLSVRRTEALVQARIEAADAEPPDVLEFDAAASRPPRPKSEHLADLEQQFRVALGTNVKITHGSRGRGKLVIHFANHEEFERLRGHICDLAQSYPHGQVG